MTLWSLYISEKDKLYLRICPVIAILFSTGFTMMSYVSSRYTFDNIEAQLPFFRHIIDDGLVLAGAWSLAVVITIASVILSHLPIRDWQEKCKNKLKKVNVLPWIIRIILLTITCFFMKNIWSLIKENGLHWSSINRLSLLELFYATGICPLFVTLFYLFVSPPPETQKKTRGIGHWLILSLL